MTNGNSTGSSRLLWAGFFAIFAAGVGFSVRGGILGDWAKEYGFTMAELGQIAGGGLWGFGIIILCGSLIADKIGYGPLMVFAFIMHLLSAGLQMATGQIYASFGREAVSLSLTVAMFLFAVANGTCEAVVNPMVATLYPREKTHYLNILHAGWPGGLIAGGLIAYLMNGGSVMGFVPIPKVHWLIQMSMFLIPTVLYGLLMIGQRFPKSEAAEAGVGYGTMLVEFLSPLLLFLLFIHAMVGYVELGTDSWISKITGSIMKDPQSGLLLFVYTSGLMFALRFFAGPIEHLLSPIGLLLLSAVFACFGLFLLSGAEGVAICVLAATVYGIGKTFFWPTMLAVVSERFPKGGALTIGAVGGVGMLSAGLLGGPGIGHKQDYFASAKLREEAPATYERYAVEKEKSFYGAFPVKGLDGARVGVLDDKGADLLRVVEDDIKAARSDDKGAQDRATLAKWWNETAKEKADADKKPVDDAGLYGGRQALYYTAAVPAIMTICYLLLFLYFKATGGYKAIHISSEEAAAKTGGKGWTDEA